MPPDPSPPGPPAFTPVDEHFEQRVRASFVRQRLMNTIGARLTALSPGRVSIELPFREDLTQQHGFLHAAIIAAIADSACGFAAFTLMPADAAVLTTEYKVNLLAPAAGRTFVAHGRVVKPGRTLTITAGDVFALSDAGSRPVATLLATMMALRGGDLSG